MKGGGDNGEAPMEAFWYRCTLRPFTLAHRYKDPNPACRYVLPDGRFGMCLRESFVVSKLKEGRVSIKDYMEKPFPPDGLPAVRLNWKRLRPTI